MRTSCTIGLGKKGLQKRNSQPTTASQLQEAGKATVRPHPYCQPGSTPSQTPSVPGIVCAPARTAAGCMEAALDIALRGRPCSAGAAASLGGEGGEAADVGGSDR